MLRDLSAQLVRIDSANQSHIPPAHERTCALDSWQIELIGRSKQFLVVTSGSLNLGSTFLCLGALISRCGIDVARKVTF